MHFASQTLVYLLLHWVDSTEVRPNNSSQKSQLEKELDQTMVRLLSFCCPTYIPQKPLRQDLSINFSMNNITIIYGIHPQCKLVMARRPWESRSKVDQRQWHRIELPYKTIYWQGINIGDWRFFRKFANIKIANINNYMDTPTKPLQKLEKKDMVAQIANIESANCFLQTNSPNITLVRYNK